MGRTKGSRTVQRTEVPEGREKVWRAIRYLKKFSIEDIESTTHQSYPNVRRYLRRLAAAGYVRLLNQAKGGTVHFYQLVRDTGPLPPIPQFEVKATFDPNNGQTYPEAGRITGRDLGWQVMQSLERFGVMDLVAAGMQKANAYKYLNGLVKAGYLLAVQEPTTGPLAVAGVYRLIKNTGESAPIVTRGGTVYDPNLDEGEDADE